MSCKAEPNLCTKVTEPVAPQTPTERPRSINFRGDRAACANAADQADAFLDGAGLRLLDRAEAGDDHARQNLLESGTRILNALTGAFEEVSAGANVGDLVEAIVDDAKKKAKDATSKYLPWIIGGLLAAVVAGIALR